MNFTIHIQPSGHTFTARDSETILQAALRQGYQFPYSCQQAICGTCKAQLLEGQVHYDEPVYAISEPERELGDVLLCSAKPLTDCIIHIENAVGPVSLPILRVTCQVQHYQELSGGILQVLLEQPDEPLAYLAGQYVEILHLDTSPKPYSIANAPNAKLLEFHIRRLPHQEYTQRLVDEIKTQKQLRLIGPYGAMLYQREPAYPLIFVAGGTGFAPFKAILEQAFRDPLHQPIYLYWGARTRADLYWHAQLEKWAQTQQNFYYYPILSQPLPSDDWQGEVGFVHDLVLKKHSRLLHFHIYASGPPEMVFAAQKAFFAKGLVKSRFYSDLLDYQPK